MILFCGIPTEKPLAMAIAEAERRGLAHCIFHQRHFADASLDLEVIAGALSCSLTIGTKSYDLGDFTGVYARLMDDTMLPELEQETPNSLLRRQCRAFHDRLNLALDLAGCRVVNRMSAMGSNGSKPYQAQLIRDCGFEVPDTLVTNDPAAALDFHERHGRVVYKSISGIRSIVCTLDESDRPRLEAIRWCPTQFQEFVEGTNIRVHVIGNTSIATEAQTHAVDYRYAAREGHECSLVPIELEAELHERCVSLAATLRLNFAGIDLKRTPAGRVVCFEVNPSPAYSYYELSTGQPIARTLVRYLACEPPDGATATLHHMERF